MQNRKNVFLSQQVVAHSSAGPSRLQVAAGFSWDVGLSSLKPASAVQDGDSSDGEDHGASSKVGPPYRHTFEFFRLILSDVHIPFILDEPNARIECCSMHAHRQHLPIGVIVIVKGEV